MTTFVVTIESAESKPLRLLVEADNWVAAWQEGLRVIGIDALPADSQCVVGSEGRVTIEVPTLRRQFVLHPVSEHEPGPRPSVGRPLLLAGDAVIQVHHATKNPRLFRKPTVPAMAPNATEAPEQKQLPVARAPSLEVVTPDPIARILSDLERQRLLARPIRISSQTGLPTRNPTVRPRRELTPNTVPRLTPTTDERRRPRETTMAFPAVHTEQLPQQFHPVQADDDERESYESMLQWAAETAWQHVPCALAMVLACDDDETAEVVAVRGERERESRGCHVGSATGPTQLGRAPSLTRFSSERLVRFRRRDGTWWELPVESVLSVPVELADGELAGLGLVLVNASRASGFTDSELRAVTYLAHTLAGRI